MIGAKINGKSLHLHVMKVSWVLLCFCFAITTFAQDDSTTLFCSTFDCVETAVESARCTDIDDVACVCETGSYKSYLSSCLITEETHGCVSSDWTSASSEVDSDCSSYSSSIGAELCDACFISVVTSASCLDFDDYGCLCDSKSDEILSAFTSCARKPTTLSATCLTSDLAFSSESLSSSCRSFSENPIQDDLCLCQAAIAESINCDLQDIDCLCSKNGDYLDRLLPCVESSCISEDPTTVRDSYTSACAVLATGGTPTITNPESLPTNESSKKAGIATDDDDEDSDGPETSTIIGVVAGSVGALSVLLVGGYFIFRKRSKRKPKINQPKLPPRPSNLNATYQNEQQGVYEMWGTQRFDVPTQPQGAYKTNIQSSTFSELDGQFRTQSPHQKPFYPLVPSQGYAELGPSN